MASSEERNPTASRARRAVPIVLGTAAIAMLSLVGAGSSSATSSDGSTPTTGSVIVECRSAVATAGDVSMSASTATRFDAVPSELPGDCRAVS